MYINVYPNHCTDKNTGTGANFTAHHHHLVSLAHYRIFKIEFLPYKCL
jgi:hypothetical protein